MTTLKLVFCSVLIILVTAESQLSKKDPWEVSPQVNRDENGNTNAGVEVKRKGDQHDVEAGWNKVVRGPNKAKPTWHVGGTLRFKRSPKEPWEVSPQVNRDENGNTNAGVEVKRKGEQHDVEAGWKKVVRGPNKSKPTWHVGGTIRYKRSPKEPWEVSPQVNRDENGNTNAGVEVKRKGEQHDVEAGWKKVVRGPNKAKPTWHVGGTLRFKRSPKEPWEVSPEVNRDENGNTNAGVEVKRKGEQHDVEAGWKKVVRGPNKAKPTWHVGGTLRFKRSPKEPWEVSPQVNRDENGNTNAGVEVKRKGEQHDVEAGWKKVVRGPNKAKPTWHVGGTLRFKRSPKEPWEVSPQVNRDENGNTNAGVEVKRKGEQHYVEAGWKKVVRGPNKAKPTWHVGGTLRFKRSPKEPWEVSPQVNRDENGNTNAGVEVKRKGEQHDVEAGWKKVVRGPNKAKPTWHVGGTLRFKRSPKEPWEVSPQVNRDENGNTNAGVEVKRKGEQHDVEAGWKKVVRGPNKAKPTWHVGGTLRFKRSPKEPWEVSPQVNRDENGNTNAGVEVKRKGEQHDVEAGWKKVIRGPNKAKPTWHVGGTLRFKRSPKEPWEVRPQVNRDENGNTNAGVEVKRKGEQHDVEAGWKKVVRGPNKAKPTWHVGGTLRFKRSPKEPWEVSPQVNRDENGNTNAGIEVKRKGEQHDVEAGWKKVVRGPNKAKPTWHVGGTLRFKRSPKEPWEVSPQVNRDENGNTNAGVEVKRKGEQHDVEAGWKKVVRGPNKAKPTWHVGGTLRFKRSPKEPWEVSPQVNRDENGNTNAGVEVKRKGEQHDVEAGWKKVVRGPNKAKPTWHVGGTLRFKRSPKEPWEVSPQVNRDENGNTNAGVEVKRKGEQHDVEAGWKKVVRGPNKAKPTWHVGGTLRFKRSPKEPWEVSPQVNRDENGNTNAGVEVKRKGEQHDVEAGWKKVVRGPNKAKPTWHVGGTLRFKRSPKEPWEVSPQVNRDENGNTNAGVEVKRKGEQHDVEAGWKKVVRGPNKAKPTWHVGGTLRFKRSPKEPWEVSPQVNRDENGNTNAGVEVKRKGEQHDVEAGWKKVVRGPNKAKPTWHVGGTLRFKRSPKEPWEVSPQVNRDENGNTNAGVEVKRKGEQHDVEAGWKKVVRGPNKAKPTWHVGGTLRFKRSPKEPWEVSPQVNRDENGNTNAGVEVKRKGDQHDVEAGWNKVVRGPNKAKPTWHVGGTLRF